MKNEHTSALCPACGSDCNERDELDKAEREIERLRSAPATLQQAEPVAWRRLSGFNIIPPLYVYRDAPRDDEPDKWEPLYLHPPAAPQQAEPLWARPDQLRQVPFLCALYKTQAAPDLVPLYRHPPAAEVQRLREALKPFAAIDLTTNQAVDAMDVLRARRALEGGE